MNKSASWEESLYAAAASRTENVEISSNEVDEDAEEEEINEAIPATPI